MKNTKKRRVNKVAIFATISIIMMIIIINVMIAPMKAMKNLSIDIEANSIDKFSNGTLISSYTIDKTQTIIEDDKINIILMMETNVFGREEKEGCYIKYTASDSNNKTICSDKVFLPKTEDGTLRKVEISISDFHRLNGGKIYVHRFSEECDMDDNEVSEETSLSLYDYISLKSE